VSSRKMTSLDAALREQLALDRLSHWNAVGQAWEDRADSRRSKSWRTRDLREAARAYALADRAANDAAKWAQVAADLIEKEERDEQRRERRRKKKIPPGPPKPAKRYEYILKVSYEAGRRKGDRAKNHHVWWDVRFRKLDGSRATESELEYAVRRLHVGEVPRGWDVVSIAWDRGKRGSWADTPSREAGDESELIAAMSALGATLDARGGMTWHDHRNEYVGGNYTVGEEEV
jgi:hypothetical protein